MSSSTPACRRAAAKQLLRLLKVLALTPNFAGRILRNSALTAQASARISKGEQPAISQMRLIDEIISRRRAGARSAAATIASTSAKVFGILFGVDILVSKSYELSDSDKTRQRVTFGKIITE